jgi:N-acetylmuramoyl-L-alanine amidase
MDYKKKGTEQMKNIYKQVKKMLWVSYTLAMVTGCNVYSANDTDIIAMTILAEARGEGEAGMYAVAAVISQRSLDRKQTARQVCLAKWQFSCWNGKKANDLKHLLKLPQAKYAKRLAANIHSLNRNYVLYADHYHATWMKKKPYWAKVYKPVKTIGQHVFYTSK